MQSLDVISVNLWQILISLCNLVIIFLVVKHFLYQPVRKMLKKRQETLDGEYAAAALSRQQADASRAHWKEKMADADAKSQEILQRANELAARRSDAIVADAKEKAENLMQQAEAEAAGMQRKARAEIRRDIVEVSAAMTEQLLQRELTEKDQAKLVDSFIAQIDRESDDDGQNNDR